MVSFYSIYFFNSIEKRKETVTHDSTPKVSVLMPLYRTKETYLREAIESILAQTFRDYEFLILDDYPDDDRESIVKSYNDNRIKYFKNDTNMGITPSRNKLIDLAQGEYLAIFDHDDISLPDRLEKQTAYLDTYPEYGLVSSNIDFFPSKKRTISYCPESNLEIKKGLMEGCTIHHTSIMVRKSILDKYNIRYEENFSPAEDYKLFLSLIPYTMFHTIHDVLVRYRSWENNTTHTQADKMRDAGTRCQCFAVKEYPYLWEYIKYDKRKKYWIKLFCIFNFIKIKHNKDKTVYLLFGFIR